MRDSGNDVCLICQECVFRLTFPFKVIPRSEEAAVYARCPIPSLWIATHRVTSDRQLDGENGDCQQGREQPHRAGQIPHLSIATIAPNISSRVTRLSLFYHEC